MTKAPVAPGQIITFYSYKGGTGRSMALANVGYLLARQMEPDSRGVLMIDWDLEAPGLHRYFQGAFQRTFRAAAAERSFDLHPGLIDFFEAAETFYEQRSMETQPGERAQALRREAVAQLGRHVLPTDVPGLFLLKAGRFDSDYPERIRKFEWETFHDRDPLFFRELRHFLMARYDYVLIDSRTGLTDTSGICVQQMPEKLVLVFVPNFQSIDGVLDVARRAQRFRLRSRDLRPLAMFPLASRIDGSNERLRRTWRRGGTLEDLDVPGYKNVFEKLFEEIYELDDCDLAAYFEATEVSHDSDYAFGERIAARQGSTTDKYSLGYAYANFARRLTTLEAPWEAPPEKQEIEDAQREVEAVTQAAKRTTWWARRLSLASVAAAMAALAVSVQLWRGSDADSQAKAVLAAVAASRDPLEKALLLTELEDSKEPPEGAQLAREVAADPIPRGVLDGHLGPVLDVAFSPDGRRIATAANDGKVRLWTAGGASRTFIPAGKPQSVAFSPDGSSLVTHTQEAVDIWSVTSAVNPPLASFSLGDSILAVTFSPDGRQVFVAARSGLYSLDGTTGKSVRAGELDGILGATFAPDGDRALLSTPRDAFVLSLLRGNEFSSPQVLPRSRSIGPFSSAAFAPGERYLVTADSALSRGSDTALRLWKLDPASDPDQVFSLPLRAPVHAMAFSPDRQWFATGSPDGTATVYRNLLGSSLKSSFELKGHTDSIESLAFSPDSRSLATASADATVRIWDIPPRRPSTRSGWQETLAFLRGETTACLSVQQRTSLLSEPLQTALDRHADCEQRYGKASLVQPRP